MPTSHDSIGDMALRQKIEARLDIDILYAVAQKDQVKADALRKHTDEIVNDAFQQLKGSSDPTDTDIDNAVDAAIAKLGC